MTRQDVAATIIAEAMLNKPLDTDFPTHIAAALDNAGMLAAKPRTGGRYEVVEGLRGTRIVYRGAA